MVRTLLPVCALLLLAADAAGHGRDIVLERVPGDDTATVGKALAEVVDGDTIRLGGGEWEFRPESATRIHLGVSNNSSGEKKVVFSLQGKRGVTIDGGGARLVFVRDAFPFALRGMTNVVLRNFTIDTPIAPVTAFSVVEKGDSGFRVRFEKSAPPFRIEDGRFAVETPYGWRRLDLLSVHAVERMYVDYFYLPHCTRDKNTLPTRFVAVGPEPVNDREVFFRYRRDDHPKSVRCMFPVGEKLCINLASDRTCVACLFEDCRDVRVEDVTIRQFGGMGVVAQRCENVVLDRYRVQPSEGHVISTSADAVMLTNCGGDCRLTHCEISHSMDDALNVHGNYLEVVSAQGDRVELRMRHHEQKGFLPYRTGDRVEFVEPRRRDVVAAGRVLSARLTAEDRVELVTDAPLGRIVPGTVVENVTLCPDVTLTDNRFSDYPHIRLAGRGKMMIARNRMERSFIALYFYDLLEYWFEAGRLRDVTVRNNVFDDCNRMGGDAFIKIGLTGWKATDADVPRIHEGVTIRDNVFLNVRTRRLEAYGVRNLDKDFEEAVNGNAGLLPKPQSFVAKDGVLRLGGENVRRSDVKFERDESLGAESYRLSVSSKGIRVTASSSAGEFYAMKTLEQIAVSKRDGLEIPYCEIDDAPAFPWRGFMLDESRHFFGKETVKRILDLMSKYKLNVFHWHLTDGGGWRIAIDSFPELVRKGATRHVRNLRAQRFFRDVTLGDYGPFFYSKADIREIVAYAEQRHVTIVPEIEFPGHEGSAVESYPALSCFGDGSKPLDPKARIRVDEVCLGNDFTFDFYEKVLSEVVELFPGEYVNVGGDECTGNNWMACAKCRAKMKELGFSQSSEYQAWGVRRIHDILVRHGKRLIGWDPVFTDGNLHRNDAVLAYRGFKVGADAAVAGHDVVMSPFEVCYLDFSQGIEGDRYEYQHFGNPVRVHDLYSFDPRFGVPESARHHVLGGEGPLWTEFVCTDEELEWRTWPRLCALAEALWTASDPKFRDKSFPEFKSRLERHLMALRAIGVNAAPLEPLARDAKDILADVKTVEQRDGPHPYGTHPILNSEVRASDITFVRDSAVPSGECEVRIIQTDLTAAVSDEAGERRALDIVRRISERKQGDVLSVRCGTFRTW